MICKNCNKTFPLSLKIDGKWKVFNRRKYCLECSPFGTKDRRHPSLRTLDEDGCRTCSKCRQRLPLNKDNFSSSKTEKSGLRWYCKPCCSKITIDRQQQQKIKCIDYKGGRCVVCSYNRCNRSLHFHHLNPAEKEFSLAKYRNRSWTTTKAELDKCILVCSNCHGEIHSGLINAGDYI